MRNEASDHVERLLRFGFEIVAFDWSFRAHPEWETGNGKNLVCGRRHGRDAAANRGFTMRSLDIAGFEHLYQDRAGVEDSASGTGGIYALPEFVATTGPSLVSGREFSYADVAGARSSPSSVKPSPVSPDVTKTQAARASARATRS
jgi:hypothetical protein